MKRPPADPSKVIATHEAGKRSLRDTAAMCRISTTRVHQILTAAGITARRGRQWVNRKRSAV